MTTGIPHAHLAHVLLLTGPLLAIPLGLRVLQSQDGRPRRWRRARIAQIPAALCLVSSFLIDPGWMAAALSLPWLLFSVGLAFLGALRVAERGGNWSIAEFSIDCALFFLPVGASWLVASRLGVSFLGFEEPVVFLTAAHFHFAGFVLPFVCGLTARAIATRWADWTALGSVIGVPLVAVGIQVSRQGPTIFELAASWFLCLVTWSLAVLLVVLAVRVVSALSRALLVVSATSLALAMSLAAVYALSNFLHRDWLLIPDMVAMHAPLNVFGFSLPALLFWLRYRNEESVARIDGKESFRGLRIVCRWLGDVPEVVEWRSKPFAPGAGVGPAAGDSVDRYEVHVGQELSGEPEVGGLFEKIAERISSYDIFSPDSLPALARPENARVGSTIVCGYRVLFGLELVFGSRVTTVYDEKNGGVRRRGFSYRTLADHPFAGEEWFLVEKDVDTGAVRVVIRSWSRPQNWIVRALRFWVRRRQKVEVRTALERLHETEITCDTRAERYLGVSGSC